MCESGGNRKPHPAGAGILEVALMVNKKLAEAHQRLLREIEDEARATDQWTGRRRFSKQVMVAMAKVRRHEFLSSADHPCAYVNRPLPIGHGQTISQPYIVAVMTDFLDLEKSHRVLEIGTGCGYQAAVLAEVAAQVYSVEAIDKLAASARKRLRKLGYKNVQVKTGDGYQGWAEKALFDAVIVTAAPERIPQILIEQLKPGGRMVIPIGRVDETQILYCGIKGEAGNLETTKTLPVAFVPMVRRADKKKLWN
ncbi:MAG TPA: protein-L-isoaspartate(D-aspartate) O-methyltransferase [Rhodospirillales bacterium]|jgi:protein-L-isoaspartate(D-aspartate) O-methyltransferase|nr:protein-L-isoaspartate(D-aspartate) O-methyltransferase [Rhodospirillales bacterium]